MDWLLTYAATGLVTFGFMLRERWPVARQFSGPAVALGDTVLFSLLMGAFWPIPVMISCVELLATISRHAGQLRAENQTTRDNRR